MKYIKLMADYECFPLWENAPGEIGNIDPDSLPISDDLKCMLYEWAKRYDQTLNLADPINSGFRDEFDIVSFVNEGKVILSLLSKELGKEYVVTSFFP